jgi:hypothetical protein
MKTTVTFYDFKREFKAIRPNNFTDEGLIILWDYLEEYENSTGEELELDIIALCCDYNEDEPQDIAQNYNIDTTGEGEPMHIVREYLEEKTTILGTTPSGTILYQWF